MNPAKREFVDMPLAQGVSLISLGQASHPGPKSRNDDFYAALLASKQHNSSDNAIARNVIAIADGISSSQVGRVAAEIAVKELLDGLEAMPEMVSLESAVMQIINATNSWMHAQSLKTSLDMDLGYVCTLAVVIIEHNTVHVFHLGDSRIWRLRGSNLEQLTTDHSCVIEDGKSVLARAMGLHQHVVVDYTKLPVLEGDYFLLTTDGLHQVWQPSEVLKMIALEHDVQKQAETIIQQYSPASSDNLTLQIVRVEALHSGNSDYGIEDAKQLRWPGEWQVGHQIDGMELRCLLHQNNRSSIFLARRQDGSQVVVKTLSSELSQDSKAVNRLMVEEWIARKMHNPHLLSSPRIEFSRTALYAVFNLVEGQSLRQWMIDNPKPSLQQVRDIVHQVIIAIRTLHRREILHQDLRPENILISQDGHVTLVDFGSAFVAGMQQDSPVDEAEAILGTLQYTAVEYFTGEQVNWRADLFSLAVIVYEMLSGQMPYGTKVSQVRSVKQARSLDYRSIKHCVPEWLDETLQRALHPDSGRRHPALSEFELGLKQPSVNFVRANKRPLMERNPQLFWQLVACFFMLTSLALCVKLYT